MRRLLLRGVDCVRAAAPLAARSVEAGRLPAQGSRGFSTVVNVVRGGAVRWRGCGSRVATPACAAPRHAEQQRQHAVRLHGGEQEDGAQPHVAGINPRPLLRCG